MPKHVAAAQIGGLNSKKKEVRITKKIPAVTIVAA
jgi:hypothetical protein